MHHLSWQHCERSRPGTKSRSKDYKWWWLKHAWRTNDHWKIGSVMCYIRCSYFTSACPKGIDGCPQSDSALRPLHAATPASPQLPVDWCWNPPRYPRVSWPGHCLWWCSVGSLPCLGVQPWYPAWRSTGRLWQTCQGGLGMCCWLVCLSGTSLLVQSEIKN